MRVRAAGLAAVAGAVLFCLATPARGSDVTIDFTGVANTSVQALGAYAGYYTGTVSGVASTPGFICDDYNNEIFLPNESWQATATSFASLVSGGLGSTLFGSTIGGDGYAAIAYLSNLMASTPASGQGDISAAIWYIGATGTGTLSLSDLDLTAQGYVTSSMGMFGAFQSGLGTTSAQNELLKSNLWIYTPTGNDIEPSGDPFPQEFIGNVAPATAPEGGSTLLYLLLTTATCFGAMYFKDRRQHATHNVGATIPS